MDASAAYQKSGLECLRDFNRDILFSTLDSFSGSKVIVWDPAIIKRFDLVAKSEHLKQHEVVSMLMLGTGPLTAAAEHNHVVYILAATTKSARKLLIHLKHASFRNDHRLCHALFVPDATAALKERLSEEKEASANLKSVISLPLRIYPLYDDFFTFFMSDAAPRLLINKDWTELHRCASAILQVQSLCKTVPNLRCSGKWAAQTVRILRELIAERGGDSMTRREWNVSDVVIIDRWLDPLSPMLYQYTYGGLIDEIFTLLPSGGIMSTLFANGSEEGSTLKEKPLSDDLYLRLRDLHISDVGKAISAEVKEVKEVHQGLKETWDASLTQTKVLVRKLQEMKTKGRDAEKHTTIADHLTSTLRDDTRFKKIAKLERELLGGEHGDRVIPFVEDLIMEGHSPERILCLIIIQSLVCGGLKPATYATYQRLFIQTYGIFNMTLWIKLQLAGLLCVKQSKIKCDYAAFDLYHINKRYGCIDASNDDSVAYPYCGYAPPLVRYVENGVKNGWKDWTTVSSPHQLAVESESTTVVCIIGGITMAEAAGLRLIKFPNRLAILTTSLITASRTLQSISSL